MDLGSPSMIFSGLLIGLVGGALFLYGKKQQAPKSLLAGAVLCIEPAVVGSALTAWLVFAGVLAGLWVWSRGD